MATFVDTVLSSVRDHLIEPQPNFWGDNELTDIINRGAHDLWRDIVNLKQEHFIKVDTSNVSAQPNTGFLTGVPLDVYKIVMIEPKDGSSTSIAVGMRFRPLAWNEEYFIDARREDPVDPSNAQIWYDVQQQGGPTGTPTVIRIAPQLTSAVPISLTYVPTLPRLGNGDIINIPGEIDHALVAWTVAYARAKERDDRMPDPGWLSIYSTEKAHVLEGLGVRQTQEPILADALYEEYWG